MAIEALRQLLALTLVSSALVALVLLLRRPVRHAFGAIRHVPHRGCSCRSRSSAMLLPGTRGASPNLVTYVQIDPVYSLVQRSLNVPLDTGTSIN